jgi:hypothetical protein
MSTCEDAGEYFEPGELWPANHLCAAIARQAVDTIFLSDCVREKVAVGRGAPAGKRVQAVYAEGTVRSRLFICGLDLDFES